jgi:DNA-binding LytR/AlgR family response regulator
LQDSSQLGVDVCADVALGGPNGDRAGLRLARSLAGVAGGPAFVLATALDRHGVEAYEAGVVDYLLKPFGEERVARCVRRVLERRPVPSSPAHNHRIVARRRRSLVFLEPGEIWAFEASERLTFVHTVHGRFDLDLSLAAIERAFGTFARVHRTPTRSSSWARASTPRAPAFACRCRASGRMPCAGCCSRGRRACGGADPAMS